MSKLLKFFIICAIVFCVGLGFTIGGICAGGIKGLDKVAEDHDWIDGSPGEMQVEKEEGLEFDSVEATGQVEMVFIGPEFISTEADWPLAKSLTNEIKENMPKEGTVLFCHGKNVILPDYTVENGVLKIEGKATYGGGVVSMNFTPDDGIPKIVVFCGDNGLKNIKISNNWCDVSMMGIAFENADLAGSNNDVYMECVKSSGIKINGEGTEVHLHGNFFGTTDINTTDADVVIETCENKDTYAMDIFAEEGDIELDNGEISVEGYPWKYNCVGSPNSIIVKNKYGDVEVFFGDTLYQ